jgi:hypothetical protein
MAARRHPLEQLAGNFFTERAGKGLGGSVDTTP